MVEDERDVWQLCQGDQVVADLVVTGSDFPWLEARLEPRAGFEALRPLFEEDLKLVELIDDEPEAWEAVYDRIRTTCSLRYPDGRTVPEFLLHIDGVDAWWRWHDKPFDDE